MRRLESQPAAVSRIISALLLGLFLVVGARFVLVAWESTPQYLSAAESLEAQQTAVATTTLRHQAQTERRLAALDGVSVSAGVPTLYSRGQAGVSALVLSCRDLAAIVPGVSGCRDDAPTWVQDWSEDFVHEVTPQATDLAWRGAPGLRTSIAAPTLRLPDRLADGGSPIGDMQGDLIIPPRLVGELSPGAQLQIVVHAPPGRDLPDRVASAAEGGSTSSADFSDYDFVTSMRALIWTLATVIISVGLLALAIAAVDRAVQRRREMIALRLLGVGASTLRRAQWWETALPVLVGTISAVALGAVGGATYLSFDDTVTALPWAATIRLGELALLGGAAVAVLAMVAVAPRIRPDDIRAE